MNTRVISQYAGEDPHYQRIGHLLSADHGYDQLRVLCAFVTIGGLLTIADPLRGFLDRGGRLDWIIGIDDVTTQEALQYLYDLAEEYPDQVDIRIFSAASSQHIFHPKVYWLLGEGKYTVIVGSANLTVGGLLSNFETSLEIEVPITDETSLVKQFEQLWIQYSTPLQPLEPGNLVDLRSHEGLDLISSLAHEQSQAPKQSQDRSHPLSEHGKGNEIRKRIAEKHREALKGRVSGIASTRDSTMDDSGVDESGVDLPKTLTIGMRNSICTVVRLAQVQKDGLLFHNERLVARAERDCCGE
ncbi:phospholipase D family protein [Alicyclobacillus contaminans]|uniref:phospholipase D family protein n=1 Tax=Alicyclobacillus contaminans TaxID=392016 RepID=UPI00041786F4|nr:phospholipase D family protein [Alicyclobacillus contaminans]